MSQVATTLLFPASLFTASSFSSFRRISKNSRLHSCIFHSRRHYSLNGPHTSASGGVASSSTSSSGYCRWRSAFLRSLSCSPWKESGLLHQRRGAFNKFDAVGHAGRARNVSNAFNPLEMNLFDDPTGGLTAGPAEELSSTEIEHHVRLNVSSYSRSIFYLLYTPFVDVISVVLERGLAPEGAHPGESMSRWFTDGAVTLQNPACVEEGMGTAAWRQLCEGLDDFYKDVEPVMPLTAAVQKHGLPQELCVPFLRQLSMDLLVPARRRGVLEILPGLILGLANGRAPAALGLPTDNQRMRAIMAADLFLGVGQETGNTDLAYLGMQLLRANDIPVPFPKQKQLTNVFSAATRIKTDWQLRLSGQLVEVLPKWMDYYKKVHHDNLLAMTNLADTDPATPGKGKRSGDDNDNDSDDIGVTVKKRTTSKPRSQTGKGDAERETASSIAINGGDHDIVKGAEHQTDKDNNEDDVDGVHDYFSSHRAENLLRLSELESRILGSVRQREVTWNDGSNKLYTRFKRKRSITGGEPKGEEKEETNRQKQITEEEDGDVESLDAAEHVTRKKKGQKKENRNACTQAEVEVMEVEDVDVKSKRRRNQRKEKTRVTPVTNSDEDEGTTIVV